jgi:tight adherence protein C
MTILGINLHGMTLDTVLEVATAAAIFFVLVGLYWTFTPNDALDARARAHARRRRELRAQILTPARAPKPQKSVIAVRGLLERLKLTRSEDGRKAGELLARAGWRSPDALTVFLGLRLGMPIGLGVLTYLLIPVVSPAMSPLMRLIFTILGLGTGAFLPTLVVNNAISGRLQKIQRGLPDALDLFVICAEAGLSLDAAMTRVSRELGPACPQLADELGLTAIELGFLPNRRDALMNLTARVNSPSIRGLVNTMAQTEKYGTPLSQALRVLAIEFRNMRMMKAEEKAARLPATMTVPMILFILPPLFVVLIGPAIIHVMAIWPK